MAFNLKFLPTAENNIEEATDYYANISSRVFNHFNESLDQTLLRIELNPFFQKKYGNVRSLRVKNFPYIIFYEVDENEEIIYVLSVFCTHQNPEKYP